MNQKIIETAQKYAQKIKKEGIPYEKIFIYGSAARGTMRQWSDIDIAVVGPSFGEDIIDEMVKLKSCTYLIDPAISPFPLRPEELEDRFNTIGQAVAREGKEI